ncbi:heterokaryon incompatibility protein [Colletotrichum salicis]|uniref:Heterokaryon incompatibility protein n=1 Tax=Colletotrichum salicis TaxID=1209931 RepID=A0A135UU76_9PEZI|nr:heterokaryon incompatibility protein [Colletotrichum salicis]
MLKTLKTRRFTNSSLPITFRVTQDAAGRYTVWNWHPASPLGNSAPQDPLYFQGWDRNDKELFHSYQWKFMAPTFGTDQPFRFKFNTRTVLPYMEVARKAESKGFFGEVFKVNVHPAHIKAKKMAMNTDGSVAIALKKANEDPELKEFFDKEASNLQELRYYKSKHLIKPIAAYEHHGDRCLLFPWAAGGNLAQYWRSNRGNSLTKHELSWIFAQLTGLFDALEELHAKNCRHGDLKPENILLFIDTDKNKTLQIADMGLTSFHALDAATRIRKAQEILTLTPPGTSRYEPPETGKDREKQLSAHETRSRAYDVWSMGCVVLELLIWLAYGFDILSKFRDETAYFWELKQVRGSEKIYSVGSETQRYIKALSTKWQSQSAWRELLKFVETRLLVVKISEDSDVSSPQYREIASAAHKEMRVIQRKYYAVTTNDGLAPGHKLELNGTKPSLPAHEDNLDEFDGLVGIERKATEELEPTTKHSLAEGAGYEVKLEEQAQQRSQLSDSWESLADNIFASQVLGEIEWGQPRPLFTGKKIFCAKCSTISSQTLFPTEFRPSHAQLHCDLCDILLEALKRAYNNVLPDIVRLRQTYSTDAIIITRGLGIEYIWIDSLCIIQDDKDDWERESTKMEEVFSAAHCTISAASARSSLDGFLSNRSPRPSVHLRMKDLPDLYVCAYIDDFHRDVELAEINTRGWVLQERALSRRTIYFTPNQVYWECGDGIRCETLGRLYNSKAAFLGDANFPQSALDYYRDGRQLLVQDLYERYSALAFTMASDRAVAILGLQTRLARALKTQAAHGSFEKYFARSILWKRDQVADMTTITPSTWLVPTWSWFSKTGKIQYMHLEFDKIEWVSSDFESPFSRHPDMLSGASYFGRDEGHTILRGVARRMDINEEQVASQIWFDKKNDLKAEDLRVVIMGRDKEGLEARAHVLVICKNQHDPRDNRYERVGVASLLGKQISEEGVKVDIR